MRIKTMSALLDLCLLLMACVSYNPGGNDPAGGSTETTNAVAGRLYLCDGKTPAKGARVAIRPSTMLPDISRMALAKRMADTASVMTDDSGAFVFNSILDTGTYNVEAVIGALAVLIDSVHIRPATKDSIVYLPPETLKPVGAISGFVKVGDYGDSGSLFVLALGIDRIAKVNADGSFTFPALAEASYSLKVVSSAKNYTVVSAALSVSVKSADTTKLDTVKVVVYVPNILIFYVPVSKLKPANNEISGWSFVQAADSFTLWTPENFYDDVDGGAGIYLDKGMIEVADIHMVGPVGSGGVQNVIASHSFIMDFGNDSNALNIYTYKKTTYSAETFDLPGYAVTTAFGINDLGGITVMAHIKNIYFELTFSGFSDQSQALSAAQLFLNFFKAKIE
jgi:hypothetical protein